MEPDSKREGRLWEGPRLISLSLGLLVLRLGFGGAMIYGHGWDKLVNFGEKAEGFGDPLGLGPPTTLALAVFAEFFCSLLVMFGLATRLACLPLIATMATALFIVHAQDPFGVQEKALLFLTAFLALALTGPGCYSLDSLIWPRIARRGPGAAS